MVLIYIHPFTLSNILISRARVTLRMYPFSKAPAPSINELPMMPHCYADAQQCHCYSDGNAGNQSFDDGVGLASAT